MYDKEQQEIRKQLEFFENANDLLKDKQKQLTKCKQENQCFITQHDFEQIKFYTIEIKKTLSEEQKTNVSISSSSDVFPDNSSKTYSCPLIRPNIFGIKPEHNIRFDCDGSTYLKYNLSKHFEYFHRMLPECALRLKEAIINGQSPDQTILFSDNEIILVNNNFLFYFSKFFF
jgi:hypothetical protein